MDDVLLMLNVVAFVLLSSAAAWAILDPAVNDGVVLKLGLICVSLGFAGLAATLLDAGWCADARKLGRSMLLVHVGTVTLLIGWMLRARKARHPHRRASDWVPLDTGEVDHA